MVIKKLIVAMVCITMISVIYTIHSANENQVEAYHNSGNSYPRYASSNYLKNITYKVHIFDEAKGRSYTFNMEGWRHMGNSISVYELASVNGNRYRCSKCKLWTNNVVSSRDFINAWNKLRHATGRLDINSALRIAPHNHEVYQSITGNNPNSMHLTGLALDVAKTGLTADAYKYGFTYAYPGSSYTHMDMRTTNYRNSSNVFPTEFPGAPYSYYDYVIRETVHWKGQNSLSVGGNYYYSHRDYVRNFQLSKGLTADGIVGPATWRALLRPKWSGHPK